MKFRIIGMVLIVLLGFSCKKKADVSGAVKSSAQSDKPVALCTVAMVGDLVRHIEGDHIQVQTMLGPGIDPHAHKPTRKDIYNLQSADIIFYSGLNLEGKMIDTIKNLEAKKPVLAVSEQLPADKFLFPEGSEGHADPHVWMDVALWAEIIDPVADFLSAQYPENRSDFLVNAKELKSKLIKMDAKIMEIMKTVPEESRVLITAHDAFQYFSHAYRIRVEGVQGISTESEAGIRQINKLVDLLVEQKVKAVFVESSVSDKNVKALIEGAASRGHKVKLGGELFSDAMGNPGTYEGTYQGMLDHNATIITIALGGNADPKGLYGKLSPKDEK